MKPVQKPKYNKFQTRNQGNKMILLDNGMIGYDGENFYRLSLSKKPLGGPIDRNWINQHVINELEHYTNQSNRW